MSVIRRNANWIAVIVAGLFVAGAAVGMAEFNAAPPKETKHARALSSAFRSVAEEALPGIVSIEARGKAARVQQLQFGEGNSPFDDPLLKRFLERDPRFKEFFEERGQGRPNVELPRRQARGSGFVIDADGIAMTNAHVVRNADEVTVRFNDGTEVEATKWAADPRSDIAVVHFEPPRELTVVPLGDSDKMQIGDWVLAVGSPFGLDLSVTAGIISAKGRGVGINKREDFLQTDAAINPGNSGGPLLNLDGQAIGVNTAISSRSGGYDGVGFAVPANMARWVAKQLIEHGEVKRAFLGVSIQPVTPELAGQLGVDANQGAVVGQVFEDSPSSRAGLQPGDVIVELDGREVRSPRMLQGIVEQLEIGRNYDVTVVRDGRRRTFDIKLAEMPRDLETAVRSGDTEPVPSESTQFDELGLEVESVTEEMARRLRMDRPRGVLVTSVEVNSPAHEAGIRKGSVVLRVGGQDVDSPDEFRKALEGTSLEKGVLLLVRSQFGGQGFVVVKKN